MDEILETLRNLKNAVDRCESSRFFGKASESAAYEDAKALLARPEHENENELYRLLVVRGYAQHEADAIANGPLISIEPAAAEKAREWRPISEAERQTQYLLYAPPESIHRNPRGKAGQYRVSSPQSFVWASHFMYLPSPPAATGEK